MEKNMFDIAKKIKITSIEKYFTIFFYGFSVFIISLITQGVILTLANIFFLPLVLLSSFISLVVALLFLKQTQKDIQFLPKISFPIILFTFFILSIIIFFPHDTFGGSSDEAQYSNMAVHLARNGTLNLPKYLNNLTDNWAEGVRSRPPVYTVWLATQHIFFGERWLLRSNVVLVGLGLLALFMVSSLIVGKKNGLIALVLFSTSMPFLWFSRETLSEVLSFSLLWILILFFIAFLKTKRHLFFLVYLTAIWLFALCRIEGFFIQFSVILAHLFILFINKTRNIKKYILVLLIYLIIIGSNVLIIRSFSFSSYFEKNVKSASVGINTSISSLITKTNTVVINSMGNEAKLSARIPLFMFNMLEKYNYIMVFASIFLVFSLILIHKDKYLNSIKIYFFVILIILLPEFYKFINPGVSLFQPWLYRRYMYALLPFGYICLVIFIQNVANKKRLISLTMISLFLVINISLSYNIIFLKNNWGLVDKLEGITKNISQSDVVINDGNPLENYNPGSFIALNRGAGSVASSNLRLQNFVPEKKIFNGISYNKIFLLSTKNKERFQSFQIKKKSTVEVEYTQLKPSCALYLLGEELQLSDAYSFSSFLYNDAIKYCNRPEYEIEKHKEQLFLYELL